LAVLIGGSVAVLVGGWTGLAVGAGVAGLAYRTLRRRPSGTERRQVRRIQADLPFAADLLASAVRAGATPEAASRCAGIALGGPLGARLLTTSRALRVGTPAEEAWSHLGPWPGCRRMAGAAVRSQHSGAALAGSLLRVAEDLRADRLIDADAAGRRAGVLIVLPLGLCFLPAFILAGLVPVVVAVLGGVLFP
jgi:pilus assembly protein TadC